MVLIITRSGETSVDMVIDWLLKFDIPYTVLADDHFTDVKIDFDNFVNTEISGYSLSQIKVAWFWKYPRLFDGEINNEIIEKIGFSTYYFVNQEHEGFKDFFFESLCALPHIKWITKPKNITENKLLQLKTAEGYGISIPKSIVVSNKEDVIKFKLSVKNGVIVKPIVNIYHQIFKDIDLLFAMKTRLIDDIDIIPKNFLPSLVQERIIKKHEVRVFFLLNSFYAVKIIEPRDFTDVDHRLAMAQRSLRYEIINLPEKLKEKLRKLMKYYEFNCASIDMIVNKKNEYIFLEINPVGQFLYHSYYTNTHIELKIAETIKKLYEENE